MRILGVLGMLLLPFTVCATGPYDYSVAGVTDFFADAATSTAGLDVAACGPDSTGRLWLAIGYGPGRPPVVTLYTADPGGVALQIALFAYDPAFGGGARVGCSVGVDDVITVVTGAGPGGGPHVRVFRITPD